MAGSHLKFDFTNCMSFRIGMRNGITEDDLNAVMLRAPYPQVLEATSAEDGLPGFLQALDPDVIQLDAIKAAWASFETSFPGEIKDLLVLGIGGSALCTLTFQAALLHPYANSLPEGHPKRPTVRVHVIDNSDPWQLEGVLDLLSPEATGVFVVSKSGTTAETHCAFGRVQEWMKAAGCEWTSRTAICTDFPTERKTSPLWTLAEEENLCKVGMPPQVGGRFSAFTGVGLFPALAMGLDIDALLDGARRMAERCRSAEGIMANPSYLMAAIQHTYSMSRKPDRRRNILVLMPYSYRLRLVADWFAQLWAESLGKRRALDGSKINAGQTPVKALGATDQHSQLQLYQDGPHDKVVVFIRVLDHGAVCPVPSLDLPAVSHLGDTDLGALLDAEYRATAFALAEASRPNITIEVDQVNEESVGELLMYFMLTTAITGELFGINTYDQPGVESSKRATHALFGRPGKEFDEVRDAMEAAEAGRKLVV
ncbi:MAG: glucose-6-phosphate isomerase [Acidobacteriota bacterium]|nr:glucose-6-phosphate isomerase [Acidobacteriota bacterium]